MAQVLKEELRNRILTSAKKELLEKGVRDASMRSIAFHSGMTVGNLYRYFKSKDELIMFIVSPALERLNDMIQNKTHDRLSLFHQASSLGLSKQEMTLILDSLADDLSLLYQDFKDEMRILFMDSEVQTQISAWFTQLVGTMISEIFNDFKDQVYEIQLFSRMLAVSIFSGLQECLLRLEELNFDEKKAGFMIRLYLRLYLSMLDFDMNRYLQEVQA
ncbi:MAG: helix-turn-helix transcriptional regulator [Erysipelotrichaceae bacterium]|nr:helix-turn-helix transcriptional regulator [Erysipelotrichaceae bacterium]MBQ7889160.1 helix-turn-helix transcriptional regulator [Erysipelotrichaceae bacterium]